MLYKLIRHPLLKIGDYFGILTRSFELGIMIIQDKCLCLAVCVCCMCVFVWVNVRIGQNLTKQVPDRPIWVCRKFISILECWGKRLFSKWKRGKGKKVFNSKMNIQVLFIGDFNQIDQNLGAKIWLSSEFCPVHNTTLKVTDWKLNHIYTSR